MSEDEDVFPDMVKYMKFVGMPTPNTAQFSWKGTPWKISYEMYRLSDGRLKVLIYDEGGNAKEFPDRYCPKLIRTLELVMFPEIMP